MKPYPGSRVVDTGADVCRDCKSEVAWKTRAKERGIVDRYFYYCGTIMEEQFTDPDSYSLETVYIFDHSESCKLRVELM